MLWFDTLSSSHATTPIGIVGSFKFAAWPQGAGAPKLFYVSKRGHCGTRTDHDRLETTENSQSTNSAKTLKIFNVNSSLGL